MVSRSAVGFDFLFLSFLIEMSDSQSKLEKLYSGHITYNQKSPSTSGRVGFISKASVSRNSRE